MRFTDSYCTDAPSAQNALDIFENEWSSAVPGYQAGPVPLFADARVAWAIEQLGGVEGKNVLELGPMEAGHSYMLEKAGAGQVLAVEGNPRAYLRCLIVKEVLGLQRVRFAYGDFVEYLKTTTERFDVVFASGVLYHQSDPMQLIADIAKVAARGAFIWTHYFQADIMAQNPVTQHRVVPPEPVELSGFRYDRYVHQYHDQSLSWGGFCGGPSGTAYWLTRDDIIAGLKHFGFQHIAIAFETPEHQNGPSLALVATR
jgi:SAM-dependent methyltransferase